MKRQSGGVLLALTLSAACSGGGDETGEGSSGGPSRPATAEAALRDTTCFLDLDVIDIETPGIACSGLDQRSSVTKVAEGFEVALRVDLELSMPPALGELSLVALTINIPEGEQSVIWDAPVESCSATALDSELEPKFNWTYFLIEVSCSQPAVPAAGNPGEPLDIGDFTLVTFFDLE